MKIRVEYNTQLRMAAGCAHETIEVPDGAGLVQIIRLCADRHGGGLRSMLLAGDGAIAPSLLCFKDGEQADRLSPPALQDGACLTLMTPISGG